MPVASLVLDVMGGLAILVPAALAGLTTEQSGYLNIALEGLILTGAYVYIAVGSLAGPVAGGLAALTAGALLALLLDLFCQKSGADSFVAGLGFNLLVPGLVSLHSARQFGTKGIVSQASLLSPRLPALAQLRPSEVFALTIAVFALLLLTRTRFGLRNRALGMSADAIRMAAVSPALVRAQAWTLSGLLAAVSGVALAAALGAWVPGISAGRGWIALVAVYWGLKRWDGTLLACLAFTILLLLANRLQAFSGLSAELLAALPYLITALVVLVGAAYRKQKRQRRSAAV